MLKKIKVSIITVCFNSQKFIKTAIMSVINQSYPDIEYIIVDGKSTDNTLNIVNSFEDKISKIISEKDNGIYDAMNKGLKAATGDIICFLNSDDFYINEKVIQNVADTFLEKNVDCIFADINYVKPKSPNVIVRKWKTGHFKSGSFTKGWHPAHPSFIVRKKIYDIYGVFNLEFKLAADFEIMLRFLEKHKISNYYLSEVIISMRLGGATNKNIRNIIKGNFECYNAFKKNKIKVSIFYPIFRLIPKIRQYL